MSARQVAERLGLAALEAEEVGGAGHVDVEEGPAHQEVRRLGGDVLGELGEPLGCDDPGQPALAAAAHQVGHGAERQAPRLVRDLAGGRGREELRLVDGHQHRIPMVAVGIEQAAQESGGRPHLPVGIQILQREDDRDPMGPHPRGDPLQGHVVAVGLHDHVAVAVGEAREIALRIDDRLLHEPGALLQEAPQQVRLAGARIALDQEPRGEQFGEVEERGALTGQAEVDVGTHGAS